jgi:hypothetical protein
MGIYQSSRLTDTARVAKLLHDASRDVLSTRDPGKLAAYGSARAAARWAKSSLAANTVQVAIKTQTLPVSLTVQVAGVPVRCSLVSCSDGSATYTVELEG